ncbi:MAG: HAMP domain-containing protein [Verrucomicrobiaceae bacterium]|nr:MAG: HAMP domain-containing protein [Verrucomicrobiaceae bacterium]
MKSWTVSGRIAWNFALVFACGLMAVAAAAYFELEVEKSEGEPLIQGVLEIAGVAVLSVALLSGAGWWLARRALQPVERLAEAAERIHEGNLSERIELQGGGAEFEKLAEVLNDMTSRLDASFQRVRQFTLYASHELKTPLSILHLEFEKIVDDPERSESDRNYFAGHLDEISRLAQIVDGLTFLTKTDADLIPLASESVAMRPLLLSAMENTAALGAELGLEVTLDRNDEVVWRGDRHRLRQLLVILCDNAVKYNQPGGWVRISMEQHGAGSLLRVRNTGPGIPPEDHDRVFDRFYRGSGARAAGTEGCGLGLSIAKWITSAHGGILSFKSDATTTEFTVAIPNNLPAAPPRDSMSG